MKEVREAKAEQIQDHWKEEREIVNDLYFLAQGRNLPDGLSG